MKLFSLCRRQNQAILSFLFAAALLLLSADASRAQFLRPGLPSPLQDSRLFSAVAAGDLPRVRQLLHLAPGLINVGIHGGIGFETRTPLQEALAQQPANVVYTSRIPPPPTPQQIADAAARAAARRAIVTLLLDHGAHLGPDREWRSPLNGPVYSPITPLQYAVIHSKPDVVALLLKRGGDPSLPEHMGYSAFHMAVWRGDVAMIRLLLAHGAKPNALTLDGQTPLELTMVGKTCLFMPGTDQSSDILKVLLEGGMDPNGLDGQGQTALISAIRGGQRQTAQILIAHRASVSARNRRGDTPFSTTLAVSGMTDLIPMMLARGADVNAADGDGMTPLGRAVRHVSEASQRYSGGSDLAEERARWIGVVQLLLNWGANPNATDSDGMTPLFYALVHRDQDSMNLLIGRGAKLDTFGSLFEMAARNDAVGLARALAANPSLTEARDQTGETLLHLAALWGAADTVRLLLNRGADPNARDMNTNTPLVNACRVPGHGAAVALLLQGGADPNLRVSPGYGYQYGSLASNALLAALNARDVETVRLLLAAHADPSAVTHKQTPLQTLLNVSVPFVPLPGAAEAEKEAVVTQLAAMLIGAGADPNAQGGLLLKAIQARNVSLVKLLWEHGVRPPKDENGPEYTPLLLEAASSTTVMVQLLLDYGADVNVVSRSAEKYRDHDTALIRASDAGRLDIVQLLLDKGAAINARNSGGRSSLMAASDAGHLDIVQLLLDKGAAVNARNSYGRSPLMTASGLDRAVIMTLLLAHGADVNVKDQYEDTVLMNAVYEGKTDIVSLLLEKGADTNVRNRQGRTVLIQAISQAVPIRPGAYNYWSLPSPEIVTLLLSHGADVNARGTDGKTALTWAKASTLPGKEALITLLLKAGAKE